MSAMSTEVEGELLVVQPEDSTATCLKKPIRSYTREFLLSLSEVEVCKKLPEDFDESLLSDTSNGFQDRQRVLGSSPVQGFKRTEYGSSIPAKGDSGNFQRGLNRWDSRSSVRSDTDSDSESGRRFGSQARRSWQSPPEHDGLLGSGSFPRPPGHATGAPAPRFRPPNENTHLNRSNEPYHPPRPYKAVPHSRREANDSFNDETFGSADDASEDRVEEEKKRRAEFELMRKEQQRVLQEKQNSNHGKMADPLAEMALLENPSDSKTSSDLDKIMKQTPQDELSKLSVSSQAPPSRPRVPPGFVSSVVDKSSTAKSIVHAEPMEIGKLKQDIYHDVENKFQEIDSNDLHIQASSTTDIKAEKVLDCSSVVHGADHAKAPRFPDPSEVLENGEIMRLDFGVTGPKLLGETARSSSILDKLFGNASPASTLLTASNGSSTSNLVKDDAKTDDIWSSNTLQSKFSRWFPEEGDPSPENPNTLLSLIAGGDKGGSDVIDVLAMGSIFTPETLLGHKTTNSASSPAELLEQFSNSYVTEAKPAVLTCEDLEQSILSGIGGDTSNSQFAGNEHHELEMKVTLPGNNIGNQASHHLLSLLQKGGSQDVASISVEERPPNRSREHEVGKFGVFDGNVIDADGLNNPGKSLTLESLFGTAFMKELHSAQGSATGSARIEAKDRLLFPPAMNENGIDHHAPNDGISKLDKVGEWFGFNDALNEVEFSKQPAEVDSKFGRIDVGIDVTLPEEDSLINLIDPITTENSMLMHNSGSSKSDFLPSSSRMPANVFEKLAVLGGAQKDERSMVGGHDPRLLHGPSDMMKPELSYQNMHPLASSPQLHASQMNHNRLFHALDSHPAHLDPQLNFMPPEAVIRHDAPTHHQFPANMGHLSFQHSGAGRPGFDHPIPSPILQQMHMSGNLHPPHLTRGFSGSAPMPPHPSHSPAGYMQEPNPMQQFPFGQQQSHFSGPGMGPTGPELGAANNPPEAFQRLLEIELRANPKQMHSFAAGSPSRPMYGHEMDMGFRYR